MIDERQLIAQLQKGHKDAFVPLYDHHFQVLYNHIYYKTLDKTLTEDVISETFLKAFNKIDLFTYKSEGSFRSRLYTIANNLLLDEYKRKKADAWAEDFEPEGEESITKLHENRYLSRKLLEELEKLEERQKDIVIMRLREGLSYQEIEEITGRASTSLRKDFSMALKSLQELGKHLTLFALLFFF